MVEQMVIYNAMKTTIDHAGRLVIPKDIRRESGIKPGMPLEVRWEKGAIAITPAPLRSSSKGRGACLWLFPLKILRVFRRIRSSEPEKRCAKNARVIPIKDAARFSSGYKLHDCGRVLMA